MEEKSNLNKLKLFFTKVLGSEENFTLEKRLFIYTNLVGIIVAIIGSFIDFIVGLGLFLTIFPICASFIFFIFYYLSRFKKEYEKLLYPFISVMVIVISVVWISNGGYNSSNALLFFNTMMICLTLARSHFEKRIVLIIYSIVMIFLYIISYVQPDLIIGYNNEEQRFYDVFFTMFYNLFLLYLIISFIIKNFHEERTKAIEDSHMIVNMLSDINEKNEKLEYLNHELIVKSFKIKEQNVDFEKLNDELSQNNSKFIEQNKKLEKLNYDYEDRNYEVTKQKVEQEFLNDRLEEFNATKDKFFSIISHDLKNPIGSMQNLITLILSYKDKMSKEEILNILETLNKSSQKTYELLQNLLDWSRSQRNIIEYEPEELDFRVITDDISRLINNMLESKSIILKTNITENSKIYADKNMLNTVLRNLLTNAIKFTPENGSIEIFTEELTKYMKISVKDSGIGISPEDMKKLFRIDVHHTSIGTSQEKGTGLGLILCKEFVEKHGGVILVDSIIDEGTTFSFTIPKSK